MARSLRANIYSTVWKYYAFSFLRSFALLSGVLVPFFTDWGGLSLFQVQLLQSWFMFCIFFLEVPTGAIADYMGRKTSLILGAITAGFALILYASVPDFTIFLLAEFLIALSYALMSGADQALLYDALKEADREGESKKVFGQAHAISLTALGISAPLGSVVASQLGLSAPVYLSSIPLFLAAGVALTMKEPMVQSSVSEKMRYLDVLKEGFVYFLKHKTLRVLAFNGIFVAAAAYFVVWFYQPLLQQVSVPLVYFGLFHAVLVLGQILIASNFVRLEKFFGSPKEMLRLSALFTSIGFLIVALVPNIVTVVIFILLAGGFGLTRMELLFAHMNKLIPSQQRATVLSSISMFRRLALVFLNPFIGFLADQSLQVALLVVGIIPLLVFLFSPIENEMLKE